MHRTRHPDRGLRLAIRGIGLFATSLVLFGQIGFADDAQSTTPTGDFERTVAPLLAGRCLECHSGSKPGGGLDLTRREAILAGGDSGAVVLPGNPDDSLLWQRVRDKEMPPKHPLSDAEQAVLNQWIAGGLPWNGGPIDRLRYTTDHRAGYDWWSLQPLADAPLPPVRQADWPRNGIDHFLLATLETHELEPSPPADPRALVRRLYFDLIGLPPEPEVVDKFVANPSDAAYADLVDALLASPHYGERWGRHWLDVARYGESGGFERNEPRKHAWHYRDWVIQALNADMPYPEFVKRQLTGDLLNADIDGAAAAGFLVAGVHNTVVGSSERMRKLARQDELEELAGTVAQTFLGMTVHCARCHDHKFDPITSAEYYRFIAALDGVNHGERTFSDPAALAEIRQIEQQLAEHQAKLQGLGDRTRAALRAAAASPTADALHGARPQPIALWTFDDDLRDHVGSHHGEAIGGARLEQGALVLDGESAYVRTAPLDRDLSAKTLEVWLTLDNLDQRGGGAISVESTDGSVFDAIVFAEQEPRRWMAGSDAFLRTRSSRGTDETDADQATIHLALVFDEDGVRTAYRNGIPYGVPYRSGSAPFQSGKSHVVFGLRHLAPGGNKMLRGKIHRASLYDRALSAAEIAASAESPEPGFVTESAILAQLTPDERSNRIQLLQSSTELSARLHHLHGVAETPLYSVAPGDLAPMRVHVRGDVTELGDEVSPGGLRAIVGPNADFGLSPSATDAERRQQLADWITAPSNALLRVITNRLWHYHFGAGLVETPNDFGFNGGRPSHADLLEWLTREFQNSGMRWKALHRLIVLSATYRQASRRREEAVAVDADNRRLWRFSPRRLEAESVRDAMLAVCGSLKREQGGPGFVDVTITPNNGTTYYEPIDRWDDAFLRRSVYRFTPRGGQNPLLDTFDCPDPATTAPRRSVTTTPLQALSLLNNAFVFATADRLAERIQAEATGGPTERIRRAWQLTVCRVPTDREAELSDQLVPAQGLPALCRALFNASEFVVIE